MTTHSNSKKVKAASAKPHSKTHHSQKGKPVVKKPASKKAGASKKASASTKAGAAACKSGHKKHSGKK